MTEYEVMTQGASHNYTPTYDGNDPNRNKPYQSKEKQMKEILSVEELLTYTAMFALLDLVDVDRSIALRKKLEKTEGSRLIEESFDYWMAQDTGDVLVVATIEKKINEIHDHASGVSQ